METVAYPPPVPDPSQAIADPFAQANADRVRRPLALALMQQRWRPPALPAWAPPASGSGLFGATTPQPGGQLFDGGHSVGATSQPTARPRDPLYDAVDSGGVTVPSTKTNDKLWNSLQPIDPVWGR